MAVLLSASPAMALTLDSVGVLWSNPLGPAATNGLVTNPANQGSGNSTIFEIRWGYPTSCGSGCGEQSGLGFDPFFPPSSLPSGTFTLGNFLSFNNQISLHTTQGSLTSMDLTLTPLFSDGATKAFKYTLLYDETLNSGPCPFGSVPCPDKITVTDAAAWDNSALVFNDSGTYTLTLLGILGGPEFWSTEALAGTNDPWPWLANVGYTAPPTPTQEPPSTVPNPSPLLLIGLGLVALTGVTRFNAHRK